MEQIVKFVMVKNCIEIDNYEKYLEEAMRRIWGNVGIDCKGSMIDCVTASEKVDTDISDFYSEISINDIQYFIGFSFETYNNTKQLEVSIYVESDAGVFYNSFVETVRQNSEPHFCERLKLLLKNELFYRNQGKEKVWDKCIWLKDKQAQYFSAQLYPLIYETENLFRELINSILTKVYGANWWNELIPIDIKDDQIARQSGYKAIVSTLNDVEDYLMSIDVSTLKKIVSLKVTQWNAVYDRTIEEIIQLYNKNKKNIKLLDEKNVKRIMETLSNQLKERESLWDKYFSKCLPVAFFKDFEEFSKNRNHVAHNKVLDRNAFSIIKNTTIKIQQYLEKAIDKANQEIKSIERIEVERLEKEYDEKEYEQTLREIKEGDSGINIKNRDEIYEVFEEAIQFLFTEVCDRLRFRMDIEIDDEYVYEQKDGEQYLFSVKHKLIDELVQIKCETLIDDSEGALSTLLIIYNNRTENHHKEIGYTNGSVIFDYDQGYYMPETQDEFGEIDLRHVIDEIVDYVNESLISLKDKVDGDAYKIRKYGGYMPIIDESCWNCGERYICIDKTIAKFGQCLCCGEISDLYKCEKCGHIGTESFEFAGAQLCEACYDKIVNE